MAWRWPWAAPERRESTGGYTGIISQLIDLQATGTSQDASATAAVEAASGALSRAFASATVEAPPEVVDALDPRCLALIGRDLIRRGESLHVIRLAGDGIRLVPSSTWYWEGGSDPRGWTCTATCYGPSGSETWRVPWDSVVFVTWGAPTARPYHGLGPTAWAADTARLNAAGERSLGNEAAGPVAQLLPVPQDGGDGNTDTDPLAGLKQDITDAKGKALLVETTAGGWSEGAVAAPRSDWKPQRLGPTPDESLVKATDMAYGRVLAACGASRALWDDSDGTSKREALRQWHMGTVRPLARMLTSELSAKFGMPVGLKFDSYPLDQVSRANVFSKLIAADGVTKEMALALSGLMEGDE